MTDARTYPPGVPSWIDTEPPDREAAIAFYGGLFGWTFEDVMPPGLPGYYVIARLDGQDVAGLGPPASTPDASWNTYVAVDDADDAARTVADAGGTVTSPPEDGGPGGRGAAFLDPAGAPFRVWQARRRLGAQLVNTPGTWNFSDLRTTDTGAAQTFYGAVFGWDADALDPSGDGPAMWRRPGYGDHLAVTVDPDIHRRQAEVSAPPGFADAIGWLVPVTGDERPHWHVTFAVADRDDAVATAVRLGATDLSGPVDSPWSRAATVREPQGATFTLSQFTPPES